MKCSHQRYPGCNRRMRCVDEGRGTERCCYFCSNWSYRRTYSPRRNAFAPDRPQDLCCRAV